MKIFDKNTGYDMMDIVRRRSPIIFFCNFVIVIIGGRYEEYTYRFRFRVYGRLF